MDIRSSSGLVRAGSYHTLDLTGHHDFEAGVTFNVLRLRGSATMRDCRAGAIHCGAGRIHCRGNLSIDSLCGSGALNIAGDMDCKRLEFTGTIDVERSLTCYREILHTGVLVVRGNIVTSCGTASGVLVAGDLRAQEFELRRLETTLYTLRYMSQYHARSLLRSAHVGRIEAQDLDCGSITADHASLNHCVVGHLSYRNSYAFDRTSEVSRIDWTGMQPGNPYRRRA